MFRQLFASFFAIAMSVSALPAAAFDISEMTEAERTAFRAEIRSYLLDNPEVLFEAIAVLEEREAELEAMNDAAAIAANHDALYNDGHSWVGGNLEGDVTVVEFVDYRCGVCRRAHPVVVDLIAFDGNVRLIMKELPVLGEDSVTAARFALAVKETHGDDTYKRVHDALLTLAAGVNRRTLGLVAEREGIDPEPLFELMNSDEITNALQANVELAGILGINGTPGFVIGDLILRGLPPNEDLQSLVDLAREG